MMRMIQTASIDHPQSAGFGVLDLLRRPVVEQGGVDDNAKYDRAEG